MFIISPYLKNKNDWGSNAFDLWSAYLWALNKRLANFPLTYVHFATFVYAQEAHTVKRYKQSARGDSRRWITRWTKLCNIEIKIFCMSLIIASIHSCLRIILQLFSSLVQSHQAASLILHPGIWQLLSMSHRACSRSVIEMRRPMTSTKWPGSRLIIFLCCNSCIIRLPLL